MAKRQRAPITSPDASYVLSVFSVGKNSSTVVRTLSASLDGLGTHHIGNRPVWCRPDGCPHNHAKIKYQWRGYFAGEVWIPQLGRWAPHVIEITEACELDMRGVYRRGQQWQLSREGVTDHYKPPVVAALLTEDDPETYPPAFDMVPTLSRLYHANVTLGVENWMPARTVVALSEGAPPPGYTPPAAGRAILAGYGDEKRVPGPVKTEAELNAEWRALRASDKASRNGSH